MNQLPSQRSTFTNLPKHLLSGMLIFILLFTVLASTSFANDNVPSDNEAVAQVEGNDPSPALLQGASLTYPIVDTNQVHCFDESQPIVCGQQFNGQDAQYNGLQPAYQDNGDGTITDLNTGLMWQQDPGPKQNYDEAVAGAETFDLAGYTDWRLPSIKELYSLALFSGIDASGVESVDTEGIIPFIDTDYFQFYYGDPSTGNRVIDSQWATSTIYQSTVMNGQECFFGFNFADGRIKCYPTRTRQQGGYFVIYVRGESTYGLNNFVDNGDGTITDNATSLVWLQNDSGDSLRWADAVAYCEDLSFAGADDWRLPNIKELHSLVDYSRSPDTTNSAAIDPIFNTTPITNEAGQPDFGAYWSNTTLVSYPNHVSDVTYIAFGRALGYMEQMGGWLDVHGAGAQRSDSKMGLPPDYELGQGPQGDARREENLVRCVRGGVAQPSTGADPATLNLVGGPAGQGQPSEGSPPDDGSQSQQPPQNGQPQQPPQEAITACQGLTDGASCSFQPPNGGAINGVCRPVQETLACLPN